MDGIIKAEDNSEEEDLGTLLFKNLFLGEVEDGDSPIRPQLPATTPNPSPISPTATVNNKDSGTLHHTGRWDTSGRKVTTILSTMGKISTSQIAFISNIKGLPPPVSVTTIPMEDKTNETVNNGSRSDISSSREILSVGIIEVSPTQSESYLSNFFMIQEPTKRRTI